MALPTQTVELPIAGGLNEGKDARALDPPGAWLTVNNWVYNQAGALQKRQGYGALARSVALSGSLLPNAYRLDALGAQLMAYGTSDTDYVPHVYTYAPGVAKWGDQGPAVPASVHREAVHRGPVGVSNAHVARVGNLVMTSWSVGTVGVFYKVTDATTGTVLVDESFMGGTMYVHAMFAAGGTFVMVGFDAGALKVFGFKFDLAALTWSSPTTLYTAVAAPVFDACPLGTTQFVVAVWELATAAYELKTWTVSTMTASATVTQALAGVDGVAMQADGSSIALVFGNTTAGSAVLSCYTHALAPLTVATVIYAGMVTLLAVTVGYTAAGDVLVVWQGELLANQPGIFVQKAGTNGVLIGPRRKIYEALMGSKPFVVGDGVQGSTYMLTTGAVLVCLDDTIDTTRALTFCGTSALAENVSGGVGGVLSISVPRPLPQEWLLAKQWMVPELVLTGPGELPGISNVGLDRALLDFRAAQPGLWLSSRSQGCLATSGAITGWFDGQSHTELGFVFAPTIHSATVNGPGTGGILGAAGPNNAYLYVACYEWVDEAGNTHRSAFSTPLSVTVDLANNLTSITLEVIGLHATRKGLNINGQLRWPRIAIYRTAIGSQTPFYRVSPPAVTGAGNPLMTLPTTWSVSYTDSDSDATVASHAYGEIILQEQGGPLNNEFPPPSTAVCTHKNRLWLASAEDDHAVWYSKQFVRNEGPGFNILQQVRVDDSPDGITALASLDDKLVIFTSSRIYYVVGDGPADTGTNGAFSDPFLVTTAAGCLDARSVVAFDGGVMFQSKGGLYLLTRSLETQFVGAAVQETFRIYNNVLAVAHDPDRSWLVWLCGYTGGDGEFAGPLSIFIVWDYLRQAWFTWTMGAGRSPATPVGHTFVSGEHAWCAGATVALEEFGPTLGYDPGATWITSTLSTPWVKLAGIGGYQRLKHVVLTGSRESSHRLQMALQNDFGEAAVQTQTWDATDTGPLLGLPVERVDCHVKYQKASGIKITVSDLPPDSPVSGAPAGFSIAGMTLLAGVKQGTGKLPAPNRR